VYEDVVEDSTDGSDVIPLPTDRRRICRTFFWDRDGDADQAADPTLHSHQAADPTIQSVLRVNPTANKPGRRKY